jgi:hypothetical protein
MKITRRALLKGIAAVAITAGINIPAFSSRREPYVFVGEVVDYIGHSPGGFIGGQAVEYVGSWDGVGFPVVLRTNTYPSGHETYYDVDLAAFRREIPNDFWHNPKHKKFPNVHTWLRMQRYGESMREAIVKMNLASSKKFMTACS